MRRIVDSTVWSLALRRRPSDLSPSEASLVALWRQTVDADEAVLVGPVRQEVLSGVRTPAAFERLRGALREFADEPLSTADYERAGEMANTCMANGVQGSPTDFLVCSVANRLGMPILTADRDFARYARLLAVTVEVL